MSLLNMLYEYECTPANLKSRSTSEWSHANFFSSIESVAVTVDEKRNSLMEFGRYVQEMLPKYVQQAQITHG